MIPFQSFRDARIEENPCLRLLATEYGGHTGFLGVPPITGPDQDGYWGECRAVEFLSALVRENGWNRLRVDCNEVHSALAGFTSPLLQPTASWTRKRSFHPRHVRGLID